MLVMIMKNSAFDVAGCFDIQGYVCHFIALYGLTHMILEKK